MNDVQQKNIMMFDGGTFNTRTSFLDPNQYEVSPPKQTKERPYDGRVSARYNVGYNTVWASFYPIISNKDQEILRKTPINTNDIVHMVGIPPDTAITRFSFLINDDDDSMDGATIELGIYKHIFDKYGNKTSIQETTLISEAMQAQGYSNIIDCSKKFSVMVSLEKVMGSTQPAPPPPTPPSGTDTVVNIAGYTMPLYVDSNTVFTFGFKCLSKPTDVNKQFIDMFNGYFYSIKAEAFSASVTV